MMIPTYTAESLSDAMHLFTGSLNFGSVNAANLFCLPALHRWKWFCIPAERAAANPSPCLPRQQQLHWPSFSSVLQAQDICATGMAPLHEPQALSQTDRQTEDSSAYCFMATQQEIVCLLLLNTSSLHLFSVIYIGITMYLNVLSSKQYP